jgi:hypothetical protein
MKMEHLGAEIESVCEQASKRELNYKEFLADEPPRDCRRLRFVRG